MRGNGVVVTSVDRLRDQLADVAYRSEAAADGYAGARSTTLDRAQSILGSVSSGVARHAGRVLGRPSTRCRTTRPTPPPATRVLDAGSEISRAAAGRQQPARTHDHRRRGVRRSPNDVTSINNLATQVAKLNKSILDATPSGQSPNDLLDSPRPGHRPAPPARRRHHPREQPTASSTSTSAPAPWCAASRRPPLTGRRRRPGSGAPTVTWSDDGVSVDSRRRGRRLPVGHQRGPARPAVACSTRREGPHDRGQHRARRRLRTAAGGAGTSTTTGTAFFTGTDASTSTSPPASPPPTLAASASGAANDGNNALALAALRSKTDAVTLRRTGRRPASATPCAPSAASSARSPSAAAATHSATNTRWPSANKSRAERERRLGRRGDGRPRQVAARLLRRRQGDQHGRLDAGHPDQPPRGLTCASRRPPPTSPCARASASSLAQVADAQGQLSSGKRINQWSDAPSDAVTASRFSSQEADWAAYQHSADDAERWLNTADGALQSVSTDPAAGPARSRPTASTAA